MALLRGISPLFTIALILGQLQAAHSKEDFKLDAGVEVSFCEDERIWAQIATSSDVSSIRGIPWDVILKDMDNYVHEQNTMIAILDETIQKLVQEIEAKASSKTSKLLGKAQIKNLIDKAISEQTSFHGLDRAKRSKCGKPSAMFAMYKNGETRPPPDASEKAREFIRGPTLEMLQNGEFKTDVDSSTQTCKKYLMDNVDEDELENYCAQLCSELASVMQLISDQASRQKGSLERLEAELRKNNKAKADKVKDRDSCMASKENVERFHGIVHNLESTIELQHEGVRRADRALDDAMWALYRLSQGVENATANASDALDSLKVATKEKEEAKSALALAEELKNKFQVVLQNSDATMTELKESLDDAKRAQESIIDVKKAVSMTMLRMGLFFEQTVRSKVRGIGVDKKTAESFPSLKNDVFAHFKADIRQLSSADQFKTNLHDFHSYCSGPAMKMFTEIKDYTDLRELCILPQEDLTENEVHSSVESRILSIVDELKDIKTWQDPYKGLTDFDQDKENEVVDKGEPAGLRQIMTVYSDTDMYKSYLKSWKIGGHFLGLLAQLRSHVDELLNQLDKAEQLDSQLQQKFTALQAQQEDAASKLTKALENEELASGVEEKAQLVLQGLQQERERAQETFEDLERAFEKAKQDYRDACAALTTEHSTYIKLNEALHQGNVGSLLDASLLWVH